MATRITVRCRRKARCRRCRQCTGKRLSRTIWSSFKKESMSHLCDSTVAGPTARRDNGLASKCEYPPFLYPPSEGARHKRKQKLRCSLQKAVLQKLHCNIPFSAVRKSVLPEAALQRAKNCTATLKKLRCRKSGAFLPLSCGFPAPTLRHPCLGPAESRAILGIAAMLLQIVVEWVTKPISLLGACAMTTKSLDNKIGTFKILLSWRFPRKAVSWTIFLSAPKASPPSKGENNIFIVVSPSLILTRSGLSQAEVLRVRVVPPTIVGSGSRHVFCRSLHMPCLAVGRRDQPREVSEAADT